jgi:hypothetical protein
MIAPHIDFRDNRTHRLTDLPHLDSHLGDIDAVVPGPDHRLEPTRRDDAGVHIDPVSESTRFS